MLSTRSADGAADSTSNSWRFARSSENERFIVRTNRDDFQSSEQKSMFGQFLLGRAVEISWIKLNNLWVALNFGNLAFRQKGQKSVLFCSRYSIFSHIFLFHRYFNEKYSFLSTRTAAPRAKFVNSSARGRTKLNRFNFVRPCSSEQIVRAKYAPILKFAHFCTTSNERSVRRQTSKSSRVYLFLVIGLSSSRANRHEQSMPSP